MTAEPTAVSVDVGPIISKVANESALDAFMLLVILALAWLVLYLIKRNDRQNEVMTNALINNTAVISELKEMFRASLSKN